MTEILHLESETVPEERLSPPQSGRAAEHALTVLDLLASHPRQLLFFGLAGLITFTTIAFLIPERYEATARLMPPDQSSSTAAMMSSLMARGGDVMAAVGTDVLGIRTPGATVVGVLNSRTVADDLINQFDLRKVYRDKRYEDARKTLQKRTEIAEDKKSGIITINVQDRDPQRAAQLARAYIEDLNLRIEKLTTSAARREREFLEGRLKDIKSQLDESTLQLSKFSSRNMTFDPQIQGKAMIEAAATLQGQLIAAQTELSGLEQIYGPENSRVRAASARVGELRSKLRSLSGAGESSGGQLGPSLEQLPLFGNTYYDLARKAKINETVYEVLTKQYELAKVQEAKEVPSIRVLDEPVVPEKTVWPPHIFIIVIGTLLALIGGVVYFIAADKYKQLSGDDPRKLLANRITAIFGGAQL